MKCYASDYCQKDKSSCSDVCGGYRVLRALYNLSRIPERYRYTIALKPENGEDLEAFTTLDNYKNDVLSMVDEGRGLYIWGKSTGNGKTSWACKIMSYFFRKIAFNTGLENEGLLLMAQANREAVKNRKKGESPELHDLAESDGVGQNATRVLSLSVIDGTLKISVKKNRYGINNKEVLMIWEVNTGYLKPLLSENPEESTEDKKDDKPDGEKDKGGEKDYGF